MHKAIRSYTGFVLTCCTNKGVVRQDGTVISTGCSLVGQNPISESHFPWDGERYNFDACK